MKKLWFKAKEYGWGWYPCSWEGWLSLGIFIAFVGSAYWYFLHPFFGLNEKNPPGIQTALIKFFASEVVAIGLFFVLGFKKGEKPSWRWGNKNNSDKK